MQVRTSIEGLEKASAHYAAVEERAADLRVPLERFGLHHQRKAARILRSGERGVKTRHGSSGLGAGITYTLPARNELEVGSNLAYAGVQQHGGVIESSRPGGMLAIPTAENVRARDDPKYLSPRDVPDGVFFKGKDGGLFFGRKHKRPRKERARYKRGTGKIIKALVEAMGEGIELLFIL
ncbi:MAG TPA: hypothetical protein VM223_14855, partial [Planctomycetota bacterium]|nr:hypothetical protein [Planctomycetota bacterium]